MTALLNSPTAATMGPRIPLVEVAMMQAENSMETPEFRLSYGVYSIRTGANDLKQAVAECDNAIALMEAARGLQETEEACAARLAEISKRVDALYNLTLSVVA